MRTTMLVAVFAVCIPLVLADDDPSKASEQVYEEIKRALPDDSQRARTARFELDYWKDRHLGFFSPPTRKSVKTKDGKPAEILLLRAPAMSMPGTDFSMALLLIDKRVIDWTSCWSYNRTAGQDLQLEDVDGDGNLDVSFQASAGWWGLVDKRIHTQPDDKRAWLYAYSITSKGFKSLFPQTDQSVRVKLAYDLSEQPVDLKVEGVPDTMQEYQLHECTITVTNKSDKKLSIAPADWFSLRMEKAGCFMTTVRSEKRATLGPGESASQTMRFYFEGKEKNITLNWKFTPDGSWPAISIKAMKLTAPALRPFEK